MKQKKYITAEKNQSIHKLKGKVKAWSKLKHMQCDKRRKPGSFSSYRTADSSHFWLISLYFLLSDWVSYSYFFESAWNSKFLLNLAKLTKYNKIMNIRKKVENNLSQFQTISVFESSSKSIKYIAIDHCVTSLLNGVDYLVLHFTFCYTL